MAKPRYAIPFNGDSRLLEEALRSGQVSEVYFAGPSESNQSHCPDLKGADRKTLGRMIALCRAHRARVNLLCNAWTLFFRDLEAGFKFIRSVPGIDAVTLADPLAISTFREELPDTEIQASIIMNLNSYEKLETALKAGIGTATLPLRFNRDADFLVRVRGLKERYPRFKIKLIANHHCKSECLFGPWHYMLGEADVFDKDLFLKKSSLNKKIYGPVIFCSRTATPTSSSS
ncbi:MAG: hypothetical protein HZB91_09760 [Elusimicrobia bacterium]|nr:hypothetical protein [Elusimicrobiota bacterium]